MAVTAELVPLPTDWHDAPPVNYEVEQALLAALMHDNRLYDEVAGELAAEHFADPANGYIYQALEALIAGGGEGNALTICERLERADQLGQAGGKPYLAELQGNYVSAWPSSVRQYAQIVHDLWQRRQLIALSEDMDAQARVADPEGEQTAAGVIEGLHGRLDAILTGQGPERTVSLGEAAMGALEGIEADMRALREGRPIGCATGLPALDGLLALKPGNLVVIGARPAMGKTALGTSLAANVARRGEPAVFWSGEMSAEQITNRLLARETGIGLTDIERRGLDRAQFDRLFDAQRALQAWPLAIDDTPAVTVEHLHAKLRRHKRRHGLALAVVDYLGLMSVPRHERERRHLDVGRISRGLKAMAKDLAIPVIALHQLNRALEGRDNKRPTLADLRDSGEIEQDADAVVFIYREHYYLKRERLERRVNESQEAYDARWTAHQERLMRSQGQAELIVDKQRQGPTGTAKVQFTGRTAHFHDDQGGEGQGEIAF